MQGIRCKPGAAGVDDRAGLDQRLAVIRSRVEKKGPFAASPGLDLVESAPRDGDNAVTQFQVGVDRGKGRQGLEVIAKQFAAGGNRIDYRRVSAPGPEQPPPLPFRCFPPLPGKTENGALAPGRGPPRAP